MTMPYVITPAVIDHERQIVGRGRGAIVVYASPDAKALALRVWRPSDGVTFHVALAACAIEGRAFHCAVVAGLSPSDSVVHGPDPAVGTPVRVEAGACPRSIGGGSASAARHAIRRPAGPSTEHAGAAA